MAVTREVALKAGQELGDLVNLLLDQVSNREQLSEFFSQGVEAVMALAAVGIPAENKAAVATNIVEGIINKVNTTTFVLP